MKRLGIFTVVLFATLFVLLPLNAENIRPFVRSFEDIDVPSGTDAEATSANDTLTLVSDDGSVTIEGQADNTINFEVSQAEQDLFETIACPAGTNPVADDPNDTLNFTSGDGTVVITGTASTDTVNFSVATALSAKANTASPTFSGTITTPLTASRAMVTGSSSELSVSAVTATELGYLAGVSSAVQTQLNAKAPTASPTFSGTVTTPVTASRALVTGSSSELAASSVTATELGYVSGVTSAIQTQLGTKAPTASPTFTGTVTLPSGSASSSAWSTGGSTLASGNVTVSSSAGPMLRAIDGGNFASNADPHLTFEDASGVGGRIGFTSGSSAALAVQNIATGGTIALSAPSGIYLNSQAVFESSNPTTMRSDGTVGTNVTNYIDFRDAVGSVGVLGFTGSTSPNYTIENKVATGYLRLNSPAGLRVGDATNAASMVMSFDGGTAQQAIIQRTQTDGYLTLTGGGNATDSVKVHIRGNTASNAGDFEIEDNTAIVFGYDKSASAIEIGSGISLTHGNYHIEPGETDDGNSGTADTIDLSVDSAHKSTLTDNVTYTFSNPQTGGAYVLRVYTHASSGYSCTWPGTVIWDDTNGEPDCTANGKMLLINFYWDGTNYWGSHAIFTAP